MRILGAALFVAVAFFYAASDVYANQHDTEPCWAPIDRPMRDDEYHDYLACVGDRLESLWNREVQNAIVGQGLSEKAVESLRFELTEDCNWLPRYLPNTTPPTISYNRQFLHFSSYLQQAMLMYLLDVPTLGRMETVDQYVSTIVAPVLAGVLETCDPEVGALLPGLPSYITLYTSDSELYQREMAKRTNEQSLLLSEFLAAYPIFYAFLHEAGHHFEVSEHGLGGYSAELAADEFTAEIFSAEVIPMTLSMSYLHVLYEAAEEYPILRGAISKDDIACRISAVSANDGANVAAFSRFGSVYAEKLEASRAWYEATFSQRCSR